METSEMMKYSALISLAVIVAIPMTGFLIHLFVTRLLANLLSLINPSGKLFLFVANTLTFPGVCYHELSHALFAFITGAKVKKIVLYHKEGNHLGYVEMIPRGPLPLKWMQMSFSACAPVITGLIGECVILWVFATLTLPTWGYILCGFFFFCLLLHMEMSGADIKGYLKGIPFLFLLFFLVAMAAFQYGTASIVESASLSASISL
ncbi:MAG: hypothetical protein K6B69_11090 [Lachnospiraceae bacterium]|nr:hypothetical protein [Lachnospiraceae bacterium]